MGDFATVFQTFGPGMGLGWPHKQGGCNTTTLFAFFCRHGFSDLPLHLENHSTMIVT